MNKMFVWIIRILTHLAIRWIKKLVDQGESPAWLITAIEGLVAFLDPAVDLTVLFPGYHHPDELPTSELSP